MVGAESGLSASFVNCGEPNKLLRPPCLMIGMDPMEVRNDDGLRDERFDCGATEIW